MWDLFLQLFPGEMHSFEALDSDPELAHILDAQCPVSRLLQLKLGAQVGRKQDLHPGILGLRPLPRAACCPRVEP